jgi:hypothetical protein
MKLTSPAFASSKRIYRKLENPVKKYLDIDEANKKLEQINVKLVHGQMKEHLFPKKIRQEFTNEIQKAETFEEQVAVAKKWVTVKNADKELNKRIGILIGKKAGGNCFQANGQKFMFDFPPDALLVHGIVVGQGAIEGVLHSHCWIEKGDMVYDFSEGRELVLPKERYYKIGKIDENNVKKYTLEEARKFILDTKNWGPWDPIFEKVAHKFAKWWIDPSNKVCP